ncbi:MAG: DMT family transporter [Stellaceae bacterium]
MPLAPAVPALPQESRSAAERPFLAIGMVLLAVALFSVMDALSKLMTARFDPVELVWGRYLAILALLAPLLVREPRLLVARRPGLQLLRGVCVLGAAVFFIAGLARLGLADATAIAFASPLLVTALSIPLLREQIGLRRWSAVAVGFLGVLVVIRPGSGAVGPAALLPLLSAACWALSIVVTRRMGGADRPATTLFYSTLIGVALSSAALPVVWQPAGAADWATMAAMGALSAVGQYLLIAALARGAASLLAAFSYSQMIWSTLMGFLVFGAAPAAGTWSGGAVIVASGLYIAHRERVRARR